MIIKANKTNLYKLVSKYVTLPIMKNVSFGKFYNSHSYWMQWPDGQIILQTVLGEPFLNISTKADDLMAPSRWNANKLTLDELMEFNLVEGCC